MTDIKKCPICGSLRIVSNVCQDCGYDKSMEAQFQYTLTITSTNGSVAGATSGDKYPRGTSLLLSAVPNSHYEFIKWTINGVDFSKSINPINVYIQGDTTVVAVFAAQKTLTVSPWAGNGTATCNGQSLPTEGTTLYFDNGAQVTLLGNPATHYEFTQWKGGQTSNPWVFNITADDTILPLFSIKQWTVTEKLGDGVTSLAWDPALSSGKANEGVAYTVTATLGTYHTSDKVNFDGEDKTPTAEAITIAEFPAHAATITWSAKRITHTITYTLTDCDGTKGIFKINGVAKTTSGTIELKDGDMVTLYAENGTETLTVFTVNGVDQINDIDATHQYGVIVTGSAYTIVVTFSA